jgi:Protein of unknown function (DUF1403)
MGRPRQKPVAETLPLPPMPGWARLDAPVADMDEAAFRAGAALAFLDMRVRADVRAQVPFDGVWRRRLALKAAAASARLARRGEDEATLRDAFFLRRGGGWDAAKITASTRIMNSRRRIGAGSSKSSRSKSIFGLAIRWAPRRAAII